MCELCNLIQELYNNLKYSIIYFYTEINIKIQDKMKKIIYLVFLMIFSLSATTAFAIKSDPKRVSENPATPVTTENRLSEEEMSRLKTRVEEIRDMEKENLTNKEKSDLKKELKGIKLGHGTLNNLKGVNIPLQFSNLFFKMKLLADFIS